MVVSEKTTISNIVSNDYRAAEVFLKHGLDFCCNGNKSIPLACKEKGIDPEVVLSDIKNLELVTNSFIDIRFNEWSLDFLVDYIINNHHIYLKKTIPSLYAQIKKVSMVHGVNHPETKILFEVFSKIAKDLESHLFKEEEILFPYIKSLVSEEKDDKYETNQCFSTIRNPISMMMHEHDSAGEDLEEIKKITDNFKTPEDACNTYKVAYKRLEEFDRDLRVHVHLENNILFPKAIELEESLR